MKASTCALLYCYYGDDFTGSTDVLEQLAGNGVSSVLFLATPTPAQLARFSRLPGDRIRRRCTIAHAGVDVCPSARDLHAHARPRAGDRSLQGLFHFRLGASPRQHRARAGNRPRSIRNPDCSHWGCRAAPGQVYGLRQSLRGCGERGLSHRPASDDGASPCYPYA